MTPDDKTRSQARVNRAVEIERDRQLTQNYINSRIAAARSPSRDGRDRQQQRLPLQRDRD